MIIKFIRLTSPNPEIAATFTKWANDQALIPLTRPNRDKENFERSETITPESLKERIKHTPTYLIFES